jgi:type VI secretion system secreted protein VgrG
MSADGFITVSSIAGNHLHFQAMTGEEELNRPFRYVVDALAKNADIEPAAALGQRITVTVRQTEAGVRCFNGFVTRFSRVGTAGTYHAYRMVLNPWLWFLGHTTDCRIFQHKTVPEIVGRIFRKHPGSAFRDSLEKPTEDYPKREYTVQYRETDLDFVSRLLEDAGICYHFVHGADTHTLVLTDSVSGRDGREGYDAVPLRPVGQAGRNECLTSWQVTEDMKPASYVLRDFDYLNAGASLRARLASPRDERRLSGELYDFPGGNLTQDDGERVVRIRLDEAQSLYRTVETSGSVRGLGVGQVFKSSETPASEGPRGHLIIKASYALRGHAPESVRGEDGREDGHDEFSSALTLVDAQRAFRPARRTPKPLIHGPQTAIVVGPHGRDTDDEASEDIWTDDHGRVLVRFHWERSGEGRPGGSACTAAGLGDDEDDERTPCFVRVVSLWAGKQWGIQFTPRIGQEVVVEFLEGDPDRPLVTGRVYNNLNRPPYPNARKTQSGLRTHSTGGASGNFNELRFDDKKGAEELYLRAERDQRIEVKANRGLTVGGDETVAVTGSRETSVGGDDTIILKGALDMAVSKVVRQRFEGGHVQHVHGADQETFVEKAKTAYVTQTFRLESAEKILLAVGASTITITPDKIDLTAPSITLNGGAAVEVLGGLIKLNG